MVQYLGGGQTPLLRGLLRSAIVRARLSGYVEFEFNDTDSAGVVLGDRIGAEVAFEDDKKEWLPINWEYPFSRRPYSRLLRVRHNKQLVIAGLRIKELNLGELLISETERELNWSRSLILSGGANLWLMPAQRGEIESRVQSCKAEVLRLINESSTLGEFWLSLGKWMLGTTLKDVNVVSFVHDFWRITEDNARETRFFLLDRFLSEPEVVMPHYLQAKGIESEDFTRLPFFVVHEQDGWFVRDELLLVNGSLRFGDIVLERQKTNCVQGLANELADRGIVASIVPKILPLIVQLRQLGTIYLTDPPYLASAQKFADALGTEQHEILSVKFDLTKVLEKRMWKALVRDFHERSGSKSDNKSLHHFQHHPTLAFLWVLGGEELIRRLAEVSQLNVLRK